MTQSNGNSKSENRMKWWQLSLFGVGCTIGTGFFLGSSMAINSSGPSVLIAFILAALGTYIVFDALAKMTAADPKKGAFRSYAKKAFGHWAGFSVGWVYWCSEMLIMGSQLTALSIFSRFWFADLPIWLLATGYAVLGLIVLLMGVNGLNRLENLFALIKIAAILMFIILAVCALFGMLDGTRLTTMKDVTEGFFPKGFKGIWFALIFAFYAFGGIEVMGLMATRLRKPEEAPKSGKVMILLLTFIYVCSIGLAIIIVPWDIFNADESPFIVALKNYDLPFISHAFNGALIIAGFSTMVAALYAVTSILVTLAEEGDAPAFFAKKGKLKVPAYALGLTVAGLVTSIVMALVMPDNIYEYVTTGAGLMLLYNWFFILMSAHRLNRPQAVDRLKYYTGMVLIILAVSGTLFSKSNRPGFLISLGFIIIIALVTWKMSSTWKKEGSDQTGDSLFENIKDTSKESTLFTRLKNK